MHIGTYCAGMFQTCVIVTYAFAVSEKEVWNVYWIRPQRQKVRVFSGSVKDIAGPQPTERFYFCSEEQ
jgi:hypothetical protein